MKQSRKTRRQLNDAARRRQQALQQSLGLDAPYIPQFEAKPRSTINYREVILWTVMGCLMVLFTINFKLVVVKGQSMMPTLRPNQVILVNKNEAVERFDIVVANEREVEEGPVTTIVKRVIGLPGDKVTVVNGELFVNDEAYKEIYLSDTLTPQFATESFTIVVPDDHYFLLGDNRDISKDSRTVGSFEASSIIGVKIQK